MANQPFRRGRETVYAGVRFRSALEARWAAFFSGLGVQVIDNAAWIEVLRNQPQEPGAVLMSAKCPQITAEAEELADVVIRCLDYAGARGIDLVAAVHAKQAYNEGRPYKHGKAF